MQCREQHLGLQAHRTLSLESLDGYQTLQNLKNGLDTDPFVSYTGSMISTDTDIPFRMRMQLAGVRKVVWDLRCPDPHDLFWRFWICPEDGLGVFFQCGADERGSDPNLADGAATEVVDEVARRHWQNLIDQGWNQVSQREELR